MKLLTLAFVLLTAAHGFVVPRSARRAAAPLRSSEADAFDAFEVGSQTQGLAARDEVLGDGEVAAVGDIVTVKYAGRLLRTGKQFDAGSISFKLGAGRVIPGWDQGIVDMRVGGKRALRIPSSLGYGAAGAGVEIPPNADLEFDCELVNVAEGPAAVLAAKLSIGYNLRTAILGLLVLSFILPVVFPDVAWLH